LGSRNGSSGMIWAMTGSSGFVFLGGSSMRGDINIDFASHAGNQATVGRRS
jgi:hypothetical protein